MVRMHSDWWVHAVQGECCLNSMDGILVCPKGHDKAESLREFGGLKAQSWHHWGVAHACASFCHGCLKALPHSLPECEVPVFLPACTDFCLNYTEFNSFIYNLLLLLFFFFCFGSWPTSLSLAVVWSLTRPFNSHWMSVNALRWTLSTEGFV